MSPGVLRHLYGIEKTHLVVKLQLQSQKAIDDRQFKGPIDCARQIIRQQGVFGIWSGFTGSLIFRANFFLDVSIS